uniref:Uncharacterized protein n=1 Tax=Meloidogyne javanica TaxID=6303 RepID=A0A915NAS5_MELJA
MLSFTSFKALLLVVVVFIVHLLGQINTEETKNEIVGLAKHSLKEGIVTLVEGSKIAKTKEDMEKYKGRFLEACDVELDNDGNIKLFYSKNSSSASLGCTMDLLTNIENAIEFATGLNHSSSYSKCLTQDFNNNTLPFAYSLSSAQIKKIQQGPILNDSDAKCYKGCLMSKCIEMTSLEVRWKAVDDEIELSVNPIGSLSYHLTSTNISSIQTQKEYPIVKIHQNTASNETTLTTEEEETTMFTTEEETTEETEPPTEPVWTLPPFPTPSTMPPRTVPPLWIIIGAVVGVLILLAIIIAIIYVSMDYYEEEEDSVEIETIYKVKPKKKPTEEVKEENKEGEKSPSIVEEVKVGKEEEVGGKEDVEEKLEDKEGGKQEEKKEEDKIENNVNIVKKIED